jgi:hypothetical protein
VARGRCGRLKFRTAIRFASALRQRDNALRTHLSDFLDAYNFARRLKTLKGLTPLKFICKAWTSHPQRFTINPLQKTPGLNS